MSSPADQQDFYAVLNLPRTAALEEDTLHRAYTERSRTSHPDHGGSEAEAAQVNAAYETLRAPEKRLKHLLQIAGPGEASTWRTVPLDEGMMGVFSTLGRALEASAKFLDRKVRAGTALAKALLTREELEHRETLEGIGFELEQRKQELESQLIPWDAALAEARMSGDDTACAQLWKRLSALQARFAYLSKWQTQVRERLLALM